MCVLEGTGQESSACALWAASQAADLFEPASAVMVGDRHHDIDAARANGCRAIGVTYGYGSEEELTHADWQLLLDGIVVRIGCGDSVLLSVSNRS